MKIACHIALILNLCNMPYYIWLALSLQVKLVINTGNGITNTYMGKYIKGDDNKRK